tara:strand:+ start:3576 stop:3878 length:303 start_codon:yes stop_codon:yes gene_type:complete
MNFKLRKIGRNKKGILGGFLGMFVATLAVVIILLIFVLVSGVVKMVSNNKEGVAVRSLNQSGISDIYSYANNFIKLVNVRKNVALGSNLPDTIKEVGYEE